MAHGSISTLLRHTTLWLCLCYTVGFQSTCRAIGRNRPSDTCVRSSVLDEPAVVIKSKLSIDDRESARLSKARQLLEQFQTDITLDDLIASSAATALNAPAQTTAKGKQQTKQVDIIVPDTYWSNGHLEGRVSSTNGIVTRWARGVKVAEPLVKYDPIKTEQLLFRQPAKWLIRNVQIAFPMGLWAAGVVLDYVTGQSKQNRRRRAEQLTRAISNLGPAIIKGGQALASRPDLLPSEYLQELQKLQDDVPRFSNKLALKTVEDELGIDSFYDVFELVETEPIAAASIGQVYKAVLKENGATVALKIQRPKCEEIIALDLYVLRWWSGVYNGFFKLLNRDIDLQSIIDDFGELIYREIDYVAEAANAQRFNELYAGVTDVFVPKVYSDFTTNKVLTMEWVDGFRLTDRSSLARYGLDESKLVDTLVQCSLRQILGTYC
jgi:ABC1 atypical kinase-like domain